MLPSVLFNYLVISAVNVGCRFYESNKLAVSLFKLIVH